MIASRRRKRTYRRRYCCGITSGMAGADCLSRVSISQLDSCCGFKRCAFRVATARSGAIHSREKSQRLDARKKEVRTTFQRHKAGESSHRDGERLGRKGEIMEMTIAGGDWIRTVVASHELRIVEPSLLHEFKLS